MSTFEQAGPAVEEFHTFGVDELFFSTTDRRGIIETSNRVFQEISHYSHEELIGAPHNIIRHPDTPGGAFRLVWDELRAGRPACTYMKNLAKDGRTYWVLATLMPVGDKYLSVRLRPSVLELRDLSHTLFTSVVEFENQLRALGKSRAETAEIGAVQLTRELAKLGIHGMSGLAATLLPAEMAARSEQTAGVPVRPHAEGPLADILTAVQVMSAATDHQVSSLDSYAALAAEVGQGAAVICDLLSQLHGLCEEADESARRVQTVAQVLVNTAKGLTEMAQRAEQAIDEAVIALESGRERISRARMQIALSRLNVDMVGIFTAELIDGLEPLGATDAIHLLCQALQEGTTVMVTDVHFLPVELHRVADLIDTAVTAVGTVRRWAIRFRQLITREGLWEELGEYTASLDTLLSSVFTPLQQLGVTATRCRQAAAPFDPARLHSQLLVIEDALARYTAPAGIGAAAG